MESADAEFIVALRGSRNELRFLNRGADTVELQRAWLDTYFQRLDDYYFVVQDARSGKPEGLAGLYNVNTASRMAEWGRWVLRKESLAAPESALLIYRCAFEVLELETVYCRTLVENRHVISFHDSTGLERIRAPLETTVDNHRRLVVEHRLSRAAWPAIESRLSRVASRLASRGAPSAGR